ncbi:MAG: Cytochrome bd terminal oxidase subunit II, partial [uncultured Friedmanniella sp.]
GPRRPVVLADRPHLHALLLPGGLRLRRRRAAPDPGQGRGRGAGADRHHRPLLGRQRGLGDRGRRADVLDVPGLVRRPVQRALPRVRGHPAGPAAARGLLRVPQPGRPAAVAELLGLDGLRGQRRAVVPVGAGDGQDHRGPRRRARPAGAQRAGGGVHQVLGGRRLRHPAALRAARGQLPAAPAAHRHPALRPSPPGRAGLGCARHGGHPRLRGHGLRDGRALRELRRAAVDLPDRRLPHPGDDLARPGAAPRRAGVRHERPDDPVRHHDGVPGLVDPAGRAALHDRPGAQPHPARLGEPALHAGADDLGGRDLPAADHRLPGVELLRVPRAGAARPGRPEPGLL